MLKKMAVFISRNGADLQCIIDACADHQISGSVDFVVSSSRDAIGLKRASNAGISSIFFDQAKYDSKDLFYQEIGKRLRSREIDWILLIEYGDLLPDWLIDEFSGQIVCCHPSLVPEFFGKEEAGLMMADRVRAEGGLVTGCTIFEVRSGQEDFGKIIAQDSVPVFDSDSVGHLYNRVKKLEHYLLPRTISDLCAND